MNTPLQNKLLLSHFFRLALLLFIITLAGYVPLLAQADECSGASSPISVGNNCNNSSTVSGSTTGLTDSSYDSSCGPFFESSDGWYWISTAGLDIGDIVTLEATSTGDMVLSVVATDASCSTYTDLDCADDTASGTEQVSFTYNDASLFYMVHILDYWGDDVNFDLCAYSSPGGGGGGTGPVNDECAGAISLTQNGSCITTTYDIAGATDSGVSSCAGNADDDVWFSFVATTENPIIEMNSGFFGFDEVMEIFSGTCGALTSIGCIDFTASGEAAATTGLTIGDTYYIQAYSYGGSEPVFSSFDMCVYGLPPGTGGDESDCLGSNVLCSNGSVAYNPTGGGMDDFADVDNMSGCLIGGEHLSAWYYFEISDDTPAGATLAFDIIPDGGALEDYDFAVFGPDVQCDALGSPIRCSFAAVGSPFPAPGSTGLGNGETDPQDSNNDSYASELIVNPGEGYFLLVDNYDQTNNPFTLNFGGTASLECDTDPPCGITTDAGTDDTGCSNGSSVTLTGSATGAMGGETYTWTVVPASATSWIANPSSATTTINIPAGTTIGDYTFTLEVTEGTCTNSDNVVIMVEECCSAEAGMVTGAAQNVCPNDMVTAGVTGNETGTDYTQTYLLVDASGNVTDVSATGSFTLTSCTETYTIYSYNYLTAGTSPTNPGTIASIDCVANCCDLEAGAFTVSAQDMEAPVFTTPPADVTVDCDAVPAMDDLTWTDNCSGTGMVSGSEMGTVNPCGYDLTRTWTYTDDCNNPVTYTQIITVNPAPEATFPISPPDVTVDCSTIPNPLPTITYTNGESGDCAISGLIMATQTGSYDECGGSLVFTYTFTDDCGRTITEDQNVTVNPAPEATFDTPPANTTVSCDAIPASAPSLSYDNGETGTCAINGDMSAVESGSYDACGGMITYTWTFTDACNRTITETQDITVDPAPEASFSTSPANTSVDCNSVPALGDLSYSNGANGTCEIAGMVTATEMSDGNSCPETLTRTWTFTDACSRIITTSQTIQVTDTEAPVFDAPPAAEIVPCGGSAPAMTMLMWTDNCDGTGSVSGTDVSDGGMPEIITRTWTYTDNCNNTATETQTITINEFTIDQALAGLCDDNGTLSDASDDFFSVTVDASIGAAGASNSFTVNDGTTNYGPFTYGTGGGIIPNLPADGSTITLTFTDSDDAACTETVTVSQASCSTSCALTIDDSTASPCNANGTPSDASDDTFTVNVDASVINGDTEFTVTDGTTVWGPFAYGTGGIITLPADGSTITLTYTDNADSGCAAQTTVSQASCSDLCALTIEQNLAGVCDDNGTLSDASDDTFDLTVDASVLNGNGMYIVTDGTNIYGPFTYGTPGTIPDLPADGSTISLTYIDTGDATCTAMTTVSQASCSTSCALTIDDSTVNPCNTNGTPSDDSDDTFTVNVDASVVNGSGTFTVTDGTVVLGTFTYGTGGTITLPADGSTITLTYVDSGDAGCAAQTTVSQASCSDLCALTIEQSLSGLCDDGGTLSDASDDTFDVTVDASVLNGGGTYTVTDGTDTYGPFTYGTAGTIPNLAADGSTITLTYIDGSDGTCTAMTTVSQVSCSTSCALTIEDSTASPCNANGTTSDPSDDTFTVAVDASAINGSTEFTVTDGTMVWGPFTYGTGGVITLPADGSTITLTYTDDLDTGCAAQTTVSQASCSDACVLSINNASESPCDDNGTSTDATDDTYFVTVNASVLNGGTTYTVTDGTTVWGPFTYGNASNVIDLPADGSTITLIFTDDSDTNCTAMTTVSQTSCSSDCALTIDDSTAGACNDNGTPSDPSDDTFDVAVDASVINGSTEFGVTDGTAVWGPFTYSTGGTISLPADGSTITLTYIDSADPGCTAQTTVSQVSCSDLCALTIDQSLAGLCDDNGTPTDDTDDTFDVTVDASALNGGGTYTVSDGTDTYGPFTYGTAGTIPDLAADGNTITLTYIDGSDATCTAMTTVSQASCSSTCALTIDDSTASACDDNGTPSDANDDTFEVTVNASAVNGGTEFTVTDGTAVWGPFAYGTGGTLTGLSADGANVTLTFSDVDTPSCAAQTTVSQASCSDLCALTIDQSLAGLCDDNGTPTDDTDDTFDVTVDASALNGGGTYTVSDGTDTYGPFTYGTAGTIPDLAADGSTITLTYIDENDATCTAMTTVSQASCSSTCALTIDDSTASACDDNGTPSDPSDDTFDVTVDASAVNSGTEFTVTDGVTIWGPFTYGTGGMLTGLPANGNNITLTFSDVDTPTCATQTTVSQASCSDLCALTIDQALAGLCNDNGTPSDATDDIFDVSIAATALNGSGTGYSVSDGTTTYGPFAYGTPQTIPSLSADGTNITLTFIDEDAPACSQTVVVTQTSCSNQCEITITQETVNPCNDNGTPSDATDDIFDVTVNATSINGGTSFSVTDGISTWGPFNYGAGGLVTGLAANGNNVSLTFFDNDDNTCNEMTLVSQVSCSDECALTIEDATIGLCDNGGTLSDPSDDTYSVTVDASALNGAGSFEVTSGANVWGPFNYGTGGQITGLPADGSNITLTFIDVGDFNCSATVTVSQVSCSTNCVLTIEDSTTSICDDNGTPSDSTDDTFEVSVDASAVNGGTGFNVVADGMTYGPFTYGTGGIIPGLSADGTNVTLTFTDIDDGGCSNQVVVNQASCSDLCVLDIQQATAGICDNAGTPTDPSDDTFNVTINVSSLNGSGTYTVTVGVDVFGPYNYDTNELVAGLPADGNTITLIFTDSDDATCTDFVTVSQSSCSNNCELTITEELIGLCDDNGTPTDPSDDTFEMTVSASTLNGGATYSISSVTNSWGPFPYGVSQNIAGLPAGGFGVVLTFTDTDDNTCLAQTNAFSPTCSDDCILTIDQTVISLCNDAGTPSDPTDDFFDVFIQASALNGGSDFTITEGANTYGPFPYNSTGSVFSLPADGSNITLTIADIDDSTCNATTVVSQGSCSDLCQLEVSSFFIEDCNDNGTPTDASDDYFDATLDVTILNGADNFTITDGITTWGPFAVVNGTGTGAATNLPTTGAGIMLFVFDGDNGSCAAQIEVSQISCSDDCALTIEQTLIGLCDNNGTLSDSTDDTYNVTVNASAVNGAANFNVSDGTTTYGPFAYATGGIIPNLPADGSTITLTFIDETDANCTAMTTVSQASCSTNCELTIDALTAGACDDNGTPSDATDDTFTATVNASSINGGAEFNVTDGTTIWGPFAYGTGGTIPDLPANGNNIVLTFTDADNTGCANQGTISQASCSDLCAMTIEQTIIGLCDNNGTLSNSDDDTYSVTVNASALNGATNFTVSDGTITYGPFVYGTGGIIPDLPADGSIISLTFIDETDTNCTASTTVSQASCSTNCELTIDALTAGTCDDNGTPSDATDDTFTATVNASSINGGAEFNVTDGTTIWGPFAYGTGGTIPGLPANDNNIVLTFTDADNAGCANQGTISQASCSDLCAMTIEQTIIGLCDNNGTLSDATDDFYSVTVNANALNGATNFNVSDGTMTYGPFAYGTGGIIENLPADGSTITLTFIDETDGNCTASTTVSQASCSTSCILTIDETTQQACQDNGTPSDPIDDTFDIIINASSINGNGQYIVTDGTTVWGPFDYETPGLVTGCPATGADFILTVSDVSDAGCAAQTTVNQTPCSDACVLSITSAVEGICDDNGTTTDASDDTYAVTVNAEAINDGVNFNVTDGTTIWGPFEYGVGGIIPDLPANGTMINLTFTDENDATCNAVTTVSQVSCSSDCQLTIETLTSGACNDNGTPSDSTDDTFDVTINASSINGGINYIVTDGITNWGPFPYNTDTTISCPAAGIDIILTFIDENNSTCTGQGTVNQASCSDLCALTIDQATVGLCDNNGTLSDSTDDTYSVTVNASAINGGSNFTVFDGTMNYGPFPYGTGGVISNLPADGSNIILTFIDEDDANCTASTTVSQVSCSTDCILTIGDVLPQVCQDNGTPSNPTDDTFDVLINASATNGNGQYIVTDGTDTWGPFDYLTPGLVTGLAATGTDIILTVTDAIDGGCAAQTTVNQASCSDQCVLNILAATENVCDDNGTNTDATDDTYSVDVNAESVNGGAEFFVTDGITNWGPFLYGTGGQLTNLPADGSVINLTFFDNDDNTCLAETTVTQTSCSSSCTLSIDSSTIGNCDDNGTGADNTDDTFSVTINASSVNGSATYSVFDGTNNYGPFNYNTDEIIADLVANGTNITLFLSDTNDANCNTQIDVSQNPCSDCSLTADAGNTQTISCGTPNVTLMGSSNEAGVNYEWTGPAGFPIQTTASVTTNISGTYFLEITNPTTGCVATDEVEIGENPDLPSVSITVDGDITCEENSSATLTANTAVANPEFTWTTPDGMTFTTQTINVSLAGEYSVIVTDLDANCDSSPAVATVAENTIPPIAIIQDVLDELNCATIAGGITIGSNGSSVGDTITYQWLLEDEILGTDASLTIFEGGEYVLIVTNILTDCTDAASVNIEENVQFPIAAAGLDGEIDCYSDEVTLDGSNSTNLPTIIYEWEGPVGSFVSGELTSVATVDASGMYILTVTETESLCTNTDTVFVTQNTQVPAAIIAGGFDLDCITESGTLTGEGSATGSNITYQWSNTAGEIAGATDFNLDVENPDTYSLFVFDTENGCSNATTETVEELEVNIELTATLDNPDCFGDENGVINIDTIIGTNAPFLVSINDGNLSNTNIFPGLSGETYSITVEDALGCTTTEEYTLETPSELFVDLGENQTIELGETLEIPVFTITPISSIDILMLNADTLFNCNDCDVEVQPLESTDYLATLVDENGCTATDIMSVIVRKETQIFVPNIFSPDNDGINDIVFPFASDGVALIKEFYIYDRWGEAVHSYFNFPPNDATYGWDGNFNGQKMNAEVFVWYVEAEMLDGRTVVVKGDVTLFR